jgi:fermentation-respiration switch protein FrsA (DUF1100 family)
MLVLALLASAGFCAAWWATVHLVQRSVLFPRGQARPYPEARRQLPGLVDLALDTPEGKVEAWLVPAPRASPEAPAGLVVFAHGNAELIDHQVPVVQAYGRMGLTVLLPEYRGYGRSAGSPSQDAIVDDAVRFLEMALARPDVDGGRVVHHGRSVGAGVACALADRRAPAACVLESPFRSVAAMAARLWVPRFLVRDPFDNEEVLARLDRPVLIFHGRCDSIVPYAHGVALQASARRATLVSYDCDHNDLPPDPDAHWARIEAFLREHGVVR